MRKKAKAKPNGVVKKGRAPAAALSRRGVPSAKTVKRHQAKSHTTRKNQNAFLEHFAVRATLSEASRRSGVPRDTVYDWATHDPEFAKRMADAKEQWVDKIESTAMDIAENRSERMLTLMLQAHRPKVYAPQQHVTGEIEHTHRTVERTAESIDVEVVELEAELGIE